MASHPFDIQSLSQPRIPQVLASSSELVRLDNGSSITQNETASTAFLTPSLTSPNSRNHLIARDIPSSQNTQGSGSRLNEPADKLVFKPDYDPHEQLVDRIPQTPLFAWSQPDNSSQTSKFPKLSKILHLFTWSNFSMCCKGFILIICFFGIFAFTIHYNHFNNELLHLYIGVHDY